MSNYLELTQLPDGTIVLRRSDDHENPIVKIEFGKESKDFLIGEELKGGINEIENLVYDLKEYPVKINFYYKNVLITYELGHPHNKNIIFKICKKSFFTNAGHF